MSQDVYDAFGKQSESAIAFLQSKIDMPSGGWTSYLGALNGRVFSIAGATKVSMAADFHQALNEALKNGDTITDFRPQFDEIAKRNGWTYKGKRGWRSNLIFKMNMRTARMAGKWHQIEASKRSRPWLTYGVVDDNRLRDQHRVWNGLTYHIDDPFWDTHFPPNGWGPCRCDTTTSSDRDLERKGLTVSESIDIEPTPRLNTITGEDFGNVPKGIDIGWNYNVGKAWLGADKTLGTVIMDLPERERYLALKWNAPRFAKDNLGSWQHWLKRVDAVKKPTGYIHSVGLLNWELIKKLKTKNIEPKSAMIVVEDINLTKLRSDTKLKKVIIEDYVQKLPSHLSDYKVALIEKNTQNLILVFNSNTSKKEDIFIRIILNNGKSALNTITSVDIKDKKKLKSSNNAEVIDGSW